MKTAFRAVLVLIIVSNCIGLTTLVATELLTQQLYPKLQSWMPPVLAVLSLASIAACLVLWSWRRWGFLLLAGAYALMFVINLSFSAPVTHTALGPLGLLVLAAVSWPNRQRFRKATA